MGVVFASTSKRKKLNITLIVDKMRPVTSKPWLGLWCIWVSLSVTLAIDTHSNRLKKHFSLFSVVQFNNVECTTDTTPAGGTTAGTCYTSTECTTKGGTNAGKCASGFGVCCAFLNVGEANAQIMENRTRLRNGEFPQTDAATANQNIAYTINKMQSDICQLRLDFTQFVLAGPANSMEQIAAGAATHCTVDTFIVATTAVGQVGDQNVGTLCGALTGEHLYIELSPTAADTATLTLTTNVATANAAAADRVWDIKVSQIECFATYRAPQGCDRYLMADTGAITSYNFVQLTNNMGVFTGIELANQRVKTCIRRSKGMCCVEYNVCTEFNGIALGDTNQMGANQDQGTGSANANGNAQVINAGWSLDVDTNPYILDVAQAAVMININNVGAAAVANIGPQINIGMVDSQCSGDYVEIPSSWSGGCGASHGSARGSINTRYCGARFGANFQASPPTATATAATQSTPVCDCSEPFSVTHSSDTVNDLGGGGGANAVNNAATVPATPRGFCLDYRQVPCWS